MVICQEHADDRAGPAHAQCSRHECSLRHMPEETRPANAEQFPIQGDLGHRTVDGVGPLEQDRTMLHDRVTRRSARARYALAVLLVLAAAGITLLLTRFGLE